MRRIVIASGLLASAALLSGCGVARVTGFSEQDTVTYQVTEKVAGLRVQNGAGETVITETGGSVVKVVETLQWRGDKPETEHTVNGGTLLLTYDCPRVSMGCGVNYKIEIPKGLRVETETGSGDVTLRSLSGPLALSSGSGTVDASGLSGRSVTAETGSGDIELKYATPPDKVELETGSGDITLRVPGGPYRVKAETGSGDATVSVQNDAGAPRTVSISAGSGDVSVLPG